MSDEAINPPLSPIDIAVALSLYAYNVSPHDRVKRLWEHFEGDCLPFRTLVKLLSSDSVAFAPTELPYPTAMVYVQHALEHYGEDAQRRNAIEAEAPW